MAIAQHFYHGTVRKYVVTFGTLFNGLTVVRDDKTISVPVTYANKEKFYYRLQQNPELDKQESIDLPRIGFVMSDMMYDAERKQSSLGKVNHEIIENGMARKKIFLPVPYDFIFELSIYTRNMDDILQVLEQILPFFKPQFNVTINEIDEMGIVRDIPIILDTTMAGSELDGPMEDLRVLRWDLEFTLKGNIYGPVREQPIIKKVYVDYYTSQDGEYLESIDGRYRVAIDPETAKPEDIWTYESEFISAHDSNNIEIPDVETDILTRQFAIDNLYFTDYVTATVT